MNKYLIIIALILSSVGVVNSATILGDEFSYQGELKDSSGIPLTGNYDFQFVLFEESGASNQVPGANITVENVVVTNGIFTTKIDFGADKFLGNNAWLQIHVRLNGSGVGYTALSPLQQIVSSPYAIHSQTSELATTVAADAVSGSEIINNSVASNDIQDGTIQAIDLANSSVLIGKLAANSVDSGKIVDGSIAKSDIGANAVGQVEVLSNEVQLRVSGNCDTGFYLSAINVDGSVICTALQISNALDVPTFGLRGSTSIAIRPVSGFPMVVYPTYASIKVFDCSNKRCTSGTERTLLSYSPNAVRSVSMKIRNNNLPIISYYDKILGRLNVYDCTDEDCFAGNVRVLDIAGTTALIGHGFYNDIAIGQTGNPIISYYTIVNDSLGIYSCSNFSCSAGSIKTLSLAGGASGKGKYSSIAIRLSGNPIVSYYDETNSDLKVYSCSDLDCSTGVDVLVDSSGIFGLNTSIEIEVSQNGSDLPVIGYTGRDGSSRFLKFFSCGNDDCSIGTSTVLETVPLTLGIGDTAIAIRSYEGPILSYTKSYETKVYNCYNLTCSFGKDILIDSNTSSGRTDVVLGDNNTPIISYSQGSLGVHSCSDENCN